MSLLAENSRPQPELQADRDNISIPSVAEYNHGLWSCENQRFYHIKINKVSYLYYLFFRGGVIAKGTRWLYPCNKKFIPLVQRLNEQENASQWSWLSTKSN